MAAIAGPTQEARGALSPIRTDLPDVLEKSSNVGHAGSAPALIEDFVPHQDEKRGEEG